MAVAYTCISARCGLQWPLHDGVILRHAAIWASPTRSVLQYHCVKQWVCVNLNAFQFVISLQNEFQLASASTTEKASVTSSTSGILLVSVTLKEVQSQSASASSTKSVATMMGWASRTLLVIMLVDRTSLALEATTPKV